MVAAARLLRERDYLPLLMRLVSWLALSKMVEVSQP
jgi:hypothetical protein